MSFSIQIIYAKLNNMAGRQTKKEVSGKFCTETWKASSLAALPWIANSCYSLKLANAEAQGLFGFVFFPGYSQCCASGKLTGNTTCLLPLFSLAEPHTVVKSMHRTPRGIAMQAGHKRNTHTQGSVAQGWCQAGVAAHRPSDTDTAPRAGDTCSLRLSVPTNHSTELLAAWTGASLDKHVDKEKDSVPFSRQGEGNKLLVQVLYKALLKNCPTSPGKAEKPDTYEELDPSTLFFQQLYFEISCSAKDMLYFLNVNEYINILPSCPCLTKCHLLASTIDYSLWFSIFDNIFCISDYLI